MKTKEKIIYESLTLFSTHGYEAVSMRDIGAAVGIRESSIYKHYAGKQAILDAIVEMAISEMDSMLEQLHVPDEKKKASVSQYATMDLENIATLCADMVLAQRNNDLVCKFRQLLTIEQYKNTKLKQLFIDIFMERQIQYNERVFEYLLDAGLLKGTSARVMALEFFSPFFLLQYRYADDYEQLEKELKEHAIIFIKEHMKGE